MNFMLSNSVWWWFKVCTFLLMSIWNPNYTFFPTLFLQLSISQFPCAAMVHWEKNIIKLLRQFPVNVIQAITFPLSGKHYHNPWSMVVFFFALFPQSKADIGLHSINKIQYRSNNTNLTGDLRLCRHGPRIKRVGIFSAWLFLIRWITFTRGYGSPPTTSAYFGNVSNTSFIRKTTLTKFLIFQHAWYKQCKQFKS